MRTHKVSIVRMRLVQYGRYPNDVWRPDIIPIGEVEVQGDTTAKEVISFAKAHFPAIPRHEFALLGWPEQREYDLEKLVQLEEPEGDDAAILTA